MSVRVQIITHMRQFMSLSTPCDKYGLAVHCKNCDRPTIKQPERMYTNCLTNPSDETINRGLPSGPGEVCVCVCVGGGGVTSK